MNSSFRGFFFVDNARADIIIHTSKQPNTAMGYPGGVGQIVFSRHLKFGTEGFCWVFHRLHVSMGVAEQSREDLESPRCKR